MRGVIYVAYGNPACACLQESLQSLRQFEPEVEVLALADRSVSGVDHWKSPQSTDMGARSVKTQLNRWVPEGWDRVLYLDVDTIVLKSLERFWDPLDKGWDMVLCRDETAATVEDCRIQYRKEHVETIHELGRNRAVQYAGGAMAWVPNVRTNAFWVAWHSEWKRYGRRDQGALSRALRQVPHLRYWSLEYNVNAKWREEALEIWHVHGAARRKGTP